MEFNVEFDEDYDFWAFIIVKVLVEGENVMRCEPHFLSVNRLRQGQSVNVECSLVAKVISVTKNGIFLNKIWLRIEYNRTSPM